MALNLKTPGVYVEEIQLLPPSVVPVATAVPAFIGYVEKSVNANGQGIPPLTPTRITSLPEYQSVFGGADGQEDYTIVVNDDTTVTPTERTATVTKNTESIFNMYYNIEMYFANGGGPCWIVPVGLYAKTSAIVVQDLLDGLTAISKIDEPTLLLYPDALSLTASTDYGTVANAALTQCNTLKDRFTIMDVIDSGTGNVSADALAFRTDQVGPDNLRYGASYYPYLNTTLNYGVNPYSTHITSYTVDGSPDANIQAAINFMDLVNTAFLRTQEAISYALIAQQTLDQDDADAAKGCTDDMITALNAAIALSPLFYTDFSTAESSVNDLVNGTTPADKATLAENAAIAFAGSLSSGDAAALLAALNTLLTALEEIINVEIATAMNDLSSTFAAGSLDYLEFNNPAVYSSIVEQLNENRVTLNPSGAMAGIYARVDRERGVWKSPANVGVNNTISPNVLITNAEQEDLNVDAVSGKSINAIRAFTGRGNLVWGGRTLAGNDNEWRYVNVRRLFIFVEESIQEATEFVVFEPNDANTWLRVQGMIEAFLTSVWRDGALAGATPEDAFFVRVGLGQTMTSQDVLEGRMIVEVGLAAVRPAEFIVLRFMHKLQES